MHTYYYSKFQHGLNSNLFKVLYSEHLSLCLQALYDFLLTHKQKLTTRGAHISAVPPCLN